MSIWMQVTTFWRKVLTEDEKTRLVQNVAGHLKNASDFIQQRAVRNFTQVDREYGGRIAKLLLQYKSMVSSTTTLAICSHSVVTATDTCTFSLQFDIVLLQGRSAHL